MGTFARRVLWVAGAVAAAATLTVVVAQKAVVATAEPYLFTADDVPERSVAIVLGAGLRPDGSPGDVLLDRLHLALDLYRDGRVQYILVSGDNGSRGHDEVNPMRRWLVDHGVPSRDVYMDHAGFRTHDTMQRARSVFMVTDAIVCTQRFHLHRAVYLARAVGIDAVGVAAPARRWSAGTGARGRETLARSRAVLDATLQTRPRYLGERLEIGRVAARRTHDAVTR